MTDAHAQLDAFRRSLDALLARDIRVQQLSQDARGHAALMQALPPNFKTVLLQLLDRLDSGALFDEESCSFSQRDLIDNLRLWADKAQQRLPAS